MPPPDYSRNEERQRARLKHLIARWGVAQRPGTEECVSQPRFLFADAGEITHAITSLTAPAAFEPNPRHLRALESRTVSRCGRKQQNDSKPIWLSIFHQTVRRRTV